MMVFLYENYVGKNPNGSLEISSPRFVSEHITQTESEGKPLIFVAKELEEGESRSLLQDWQIQKLDSGMGWYATADYDTRTVEAGGRGVGWAGAKLYPSWTLDGMEGCTLVVSVEPLTNAVSTGAIELKSERNQLLKTGKFRVSQKSDLDHQVREFKFPIKMRPGPGRLLDFMAISNVGGKYRIHDIRLVREPYIEEREATAETEEPPGETEEK